ncbi:hypothetical protein DPMN_025408 [Dreissena polymorpha]|uniref:Uncharacterized protein n=1 Tax=Dreissena polymorpha TaxID=45954 RepID=A0A9D4RBM6_DREPO|nr:hypothetical protein DPMN_025408 [Dreissena polymorpha]
MFLVLLHPCAVWIRKASYLTPTQPLRKCSSCGGAGRKGPSVAATQGYTMTRGTSRNIQNLPMESRPAWRF